MLFVVAVGVVVPEVVLIFVGSSPALSGLIATIGVIGMVLVNLLYADRDSRPGRTGL